ALVPLARLMPHPPALAGAAGVEAPGGPLADHEAGHRATGSTDPRDTEGNGSGRDGSGSDGGSGGGAVLVGDAYYAAKQQLFVAEQHALRHNHFVVDVLHPHKHVMHMARCLLGGSCGGVSSGQQQRRLSFDGGSGGWHDGGADGHCGGSDGYEMAGDAPDVARVAVCLLHDALTATGLGAEETTAPETLAAAALVAALQLLAAEPPPAAGSLAGGEGSRAAAAAARAAALVSATGLPPAEVSRLALALLQVPQALRARLGSADGASVPLAVAHA
ncbi:hypothetical protein MNEG_10974, partial [Monoraphidium neglectum]